MRESLREERTLWVTDQIAQDNFPEDLEAFYLLNNPPAEEKPPTEEDGGKKGKVPGVLVLYIRVTAVHSNKKLLQLLALSTRHDNGAATYHRCGILSGRVRWRFCTIQKPIAPAMTSKTRGETTEDSFLSCTELFHTSKRLHSK